MLNSVFFSLLILFVFPTEVLAVFQAGSLMDDVFEGVGLCSSFKISSSGWND
jgi:hypothetical protein